MANGYSLATWLIILAPLSVFLAIAVWVVEILNVFSQWRPVIPVIIIFSVIFLVIGAFVRAKLGKITL
ncbi:MAG: hypothetical protein QXN74_00445 [Saccharolobus sp.]